MLKKRNGFSSLPKEEDNQPQDNPNDQQQNLEKPQNKTLPTFNNLKRLMSLTNLNSNRELPEDIMADSEMFIDHGEVNVPIWKRKRFHFIIGLSVGVLAAFGASTTPTAQTHLNEIQGFLASHISEMDYLSKMMPMTDLMDEFLGNVTSFFTPVPSSDQPFMPALTLREQYDLKPHFPVVLIPGVISSGLESWSTSEKSRKYFRKRMWGTTTMFRSVLLDKEAWTENVMLDPVTGVDPPGAKVRVVQGVEAADYFVTGYWVWARIIENLATIGYDTNNMFFASYDWRLSFSNLEVRDNYFSKLKNTIESSKKTLGKKSVIISHSMGGSMFPYFLKWVESEKGGNGGPTWTEDHIESLANIAGPLMGVPKALTSLLSGDTKDTMALGSFGAYILEKFFSRRERSKLLRSWLGGSSMLPKGGKAIWGSKDDAPDDHIDEKYESFGNMISFVPRPETFDPNEAQQPKSIYDELLLKNYTVAESFDLLINNTDENYGKQLQANYSFGITTNEKQLKANDNDPTKWSNPLESRLPNAPNMKIYCFYGVGVQTERAYYYAITNNAKADNSCAFNGTSDSKEKCELLKKIDSKLDLDSSKLTKDSIADKKPTPPAPATNQTPGLCIDPTVSDPVQGTETGIRLSDGDGTVPLLSLGYMCAPSGGWRKHAKLYNPGKSPVVLREYQNEGSSSKLDVRGGSKASDHIDILGNWEMTFDLLQLVSGHGSNVTERIISDIENIAKKVEL